jgi:hypothetical protein
MVHDKDYPFTAASPAVLVQECLTLDYFHPNDDDVVPIPVTFNEKQGKIILAVGDNASGKSFFRRIVQAVCHKAGVECIHLSMQGRSNGDIGGAFQRIVVYGTETDESTGRNSVNTILGAIRTSQSRENKHVLFFDEPDIGLSDTWAASIGVELLKFSEQPNDNLVAVFIVTHSRELVWSLLPGQPHSLCFNEKPTTLGEWVQSSSRVRPLTDLAEISQRRYKLITGVMKKNGVKY